MRTVYQIRDMLGETIAEHVAVRWPGGQKRMYWQVPGCDARDGLMGLSTPDLPLYGAERIPSLTIGETVILTEGEKARDALWALGFDALGTVTGASATPGEDALSVLLPFDVVLWPDHDREGHQHMNRIAWELHRLGGHLPRAIVPEWVGEDGTIRHGLLKKGFDAADLSPKTDRAGIVSDLLQSARPWRLHPEPTRPKLVRPTYDRARDDERVGTARTHLLRVVEERLGPPKEVRQGTPWWCCPFHADRSPSFKVDPRQPFYKCFGCDARGDVFTFLQALDGVAFKDALSELAPAAGIGGIPRFGA
ncbi:MAG TPA: CHC2 zinc finger domain-containing protein [Candidatus Saccharimonadia bacterium]|nr:CHC2 zinc finger domain-containing protein [Candidatus Saccharimonadia bacterium]